MIGLIVAWGIIAVVTGIWGLLFGAYWNRLHGLYQTNPIKYGGMKLKKSNSLIWWLLGGSLIVVSGIVVLVVDFLYDTKREFAQQIEAEANPVIPSSWVEYRNTELNFAISYPPDGFVSAEKKDDERAYVRIENYDSGVFTHEVKKGQYYIEIRVPTKKDNCPANVPSSALKDRKIIRGITIYRWFTVDEQGQKEMMCAHNDENGRNYYVAVTTYGELSGSDIFDSFSFVR